MEQVNMEQMIQLMRFFRTCLWPVSIVIILMIIYIVSIFIKSKRTNYSLVSAIVFFGFTRVLIVKHYMFMNELEWQKLTYPHTLAVAYYSSLFVLFILSLRSIKKMWNDIGWLNRLFGISLATSVAIFTFRSFYIPYSTLQG